MAEKKDFEEKKRILEAALFIAARPMALAELYDVVKIPKPEIKKILESMESHYSDHGIRLAERDGLYELTIRDEFVKHVEHLAPERDFSRATMQTLSLIAYRSPMRQSEVIEIRGNRAYDHVKELVSKGFVRSEPKGHTNLLHITKKFLDYFNISSEKEMKVYFAREGIAPAPPEKKDDFPDADVASEASAEIKEQPPAVSDGAWKESSSESSNANTDSGRHKTEQKPRAKKSPASAVEQPYKSQFSDVL